LYYKEPVWNIFLQHIGATIFLATLSVVLAFVMAYYIGKFLYLKNNSYFNLFFNNLTKIFIATPAFILSILLLWFFSIQWNLLPTSGYFIQKNPLTLQNEWNFSYLILPLMASSIRPFAIFLQMNMKLLEDENQKEYVKTAKSKGLKLAQIYDFHIFPNIFSTLISVFFTWWATLLSGAFFIEFIFDYPGIGKLLVDSILQNDYPMVSGLCLLSALIFLSINTLNEILVLRYRVQ
jgi:peptide/nickel transport system permease protein